MAPPGFLIAKGASLTSLCQNFQVAEAGDTVPPLEVRRPWLPPYQLRGFLVCAPSLTVIAVEI